MKFIEDIEVPDGYKSHINLRYVSEILKMPLSMRGKDNEIGYVVKVKLLNSDRWVVVWKGSQEEDRDVFYDVLLKELDSEV
jgi:hypothetical protein